MAAPPQPSNRQPFHPESFVVAGQESLGQARNRIRKRRTNDRTQFLPAIEPGSHRQLTTAQ